MNRSFVFLSLLAGALLLASCSTTEPIDDPIDTPVDDPLSRLPVAKREYDAARGGLQITRIYYNQGVNRDTGGIYDEWIVLQTDRVVETKGWKLNAGDPGQNYPLPDTIRRVLYIYTHADRDASDTTLGLELTAGKWIWNNDEADTSRLEDGSGNVADEYSYITP